MSCSGVLTSATAYPPASEAPPPPAATGSQVSGIIIDDTAQTISKAKLTVHVPAVAVLTYVNTLIERPPLPPVTTWTDSVAPSYIVSPDGSAKPFGLFPDVPVSTLAFGAVPVSAVVHIRQHEVGGVPTPLTAVVRASGVKLKDPETGLLQNYLEAPHAIGQVDVSVSDVKVDQVPVDVGPSCGLSTPATLSLSAGSGYYEPTKPAPPGWWQPLQTSNGGGTASGQIDIPPFEGCHNGTENLDPLLTALVSGPGNPVKALQTVTLKPYDKLPPLPSNVAGQTSGTTKQRGAATQTGTQALTFKEWSRSEAGLPHLGIGAGWTPLLTYSFLLADVNRAFGFSGAKRQGACPPLVSDGNQMLMAAGGTVTVGTTKFTSTNPSPDATFNTLMQKAAADVAALGAQCYADQNAGNWTQVLAEIDSARSRAVDLGVVPAWN